MDRHQILEERKARLSDARRALLEKLESGKVNPAQCQSAIDDLAPLADPFAPFPLTDVQQAYWVGRNGDFELGNVASSSYLELEIEHFDPARFELALARIIERHDMLRAIICADAQQQVLPQVPAYRLAAYNLTSSSRVEKHAHCAWVRTQMLHEKRDTGQWPLFDVRATLLPAKRAILHICFDILIADAQSVRILTRDLNTFYADPCAQMASLAMTFRKCVLADEQRKSMPSYQKSRDYWVRRLPDLPAAPPLPLVRSPRDLIRPRFSRHSGSLPSSLWKQFRESCMQRDLTPSVAVLAAFAEVLARETSAPRFTINLTLYNRPPIHPQVQEIVGDFSSLILLAFEGGGADSFVSRATRLQKQLWSDLEHSAFNGVEVLRALAQRRADRSTAAMPVVFTSNLLDDKALRTFPMTALGKIVDSVTQTPQVCLDHQVTEDDGRLVFSWDAVDELFPPGFLDNLLTSFTSRLQQLATLKDHWDAIVELPSSPGRSNRVAKASLEVTVLRLLQEILDREDVSTRSNLFDLGATSVDLLRIANRLERETGIRPSMEDLLCAETVASLAALYLVSPPAPVISSVAGPALLLDPRERDIFKAAQHAIRKELSDQPYLTLPAVSFSEQERNALRRRNVREFSLRPVLLQQIGSLLECLRQYRRQGQPKYAYPSAGGLYALQTYLHCCPGRVEGLEPGSYYYNPVEHVLYRISASAEALDNIHGWINRPVSKQSSFTLFLIADLRVTTPMYGNRSTQFCLYEAGAMGQLLMMQAASCKLGLCNIGHVDEAPLRSLFALSSDHLVLHTLLAGLPAREESDD